MPFPNQDGGSKEKADYTSETDIDMTEDDYARKRTQMQQGTQPSHSAGGQGAALALPPAPIDPLSSSSKQVLKRAKTHEAAEEQKEGDLGKVVSALAGSFEERRRAQ